MKRLFIFIVIFLAYSINLQAYVDVSSGSSNDIIGRFLRLSDGRLFSVIERNPDWGSGDLFASFSNDNGITWTVPQAIITGTGNQSTFSVIQSVDDSLRIFYASDESGFYKIYSQSSVDGLIWSNKKEILLGWPETQEYYDPHVIVESDGSFSMVYILMGGGVCVAHAPVNGEWDTLKTFIQAGAYRARLCKNSSGQYLLAFHYRDCSNNYNVYTLQSSDFIQWDLMTQITNNDNSHDPYCNVDNEGNFVITYSKNTSLIYNLCLKRSLDGITWSDEVALTNDDTHNTQSCFFIEGDILRLMWTHAINYDTDNDILYNEISLLPLIIKKDNSNFQTPVIGSNFVQIFLNRNGEKAKVQIYNNLGKLFYCNNTNENGLIVNTEMFPHGIYFIQLNSTKTFNNYKFIK